MHTLTRTPKHTHLHTRIHTHAHTHTHILTHPQTQGIKDGMRDSLLRYKRNDLGSMVCMCMCMCVCMCVCVCMCMCVRVRACACVCACAFSLLFLMSVCFFPLHILDHPLRLSLACTFYDTLLRLLTCLHILRHFLHFLMPARFRSPFCVFFCLHVLGQPLQFLTCLHILHHPLLFSLAHALQHERMHLHQPLCLCSLA